MLLAGLTTAAVTVAAVAQQDDRSAAYASLASLPDWSGWWGHNTPTADDLRRNPPPFQASLVRSDAGPGAVDSAPDPLRYCRPQQFTGSNGGFVEAVEFLFTPGRVTITNEMGLIRRIYTDGRALPFDLDATNTGYSVGRWEEETLLVYTSGLNPNALYPGAIQGAVPIGANARITERIYLRNADTLQIDVVVTAPEALTEPDRRTRVYNRLPKTAANEITFCADYDRSIEPDTGKQRFDLTPPADLPPPPVR